jgi:hypothetical protein
VAGEAPVATEEPKPAKPPVYTTEGLANEFRQAEILSNVTQSIWNQTTEELEVREHPFAIILTQDCDLLWDYEQRAKGQEGKLDSILLYTCELAHDVRATIGGRDIWKRIIQNNNERYHLLEAAPAHHDLRTEGMGAIVIDFKSFFTLTPEDLYAQCEAQAAQRRCRLEMPYREHLQCRAAFYFQRVTLPTPHEYVAPTLVTAPA